MNRISINICYKDRPSELALLLQSLRTQKRKDFDVFILDDASTTPLTQYGFLTTIINRLKFEGHGFYVIRNDVSKGVSLSRQRLVEFTLETNDEGYICRLDDDVVLAPDYLEKLMEVIGEGYDLASGVTPPAASPVMPRSIRFVSPIINRVVLDSNGQFLINCDDCGHTYLTETILPTHHFRSCALYKKEIHKKVSYEDTLTECGFREEEFLSFRMILEGYKLGVHTGAIAWHLVASSGGDRRQDYVQKSLQNQRMLNRFVKKTYKLRGDFIKEYNNRLGVNDTPEDEKRSLYKNNNLIYSKED